MVKPARASASDIGKAANESPPASEFADSQHQFIAAFLQVEIDGVVFRIDYAKKPGIAETLGAAATIKNPAIQKHADVVAVTDVELFHLVSVAVNAGARIYDFHAGLGRQSRGKIALEGHPGMRGLAIPIDDHETRRLGLYVLPGDGAALRFRERPFKV